MSVPNLNNSYIIERTTLPISKQKVKYHSMTANDAKVFVMLKEDVTFIDLLDNVKRVLSNCIKSDLDLEKLTYLDLQWLFLKIRIASKGHISELKYVCKNTLSNGNVCGKRFQYDLNLNDVQMSEPDEDRIRYVEIPNTDIKVFLKDIDVESLEHLSDDSGRINPSNLFDSIALSIDKIVEGEGDNSIVHGDFTLKDLNQFLGDCPVSVFNEIEENFIKKGSKLKHKIELVCPSCGKKDEETLEGLINFF